ncbi:MAG: hypothetical protein AAGI11_18545 [Pseudomonadota bacterium]
MLRAVASQIFITFVLLGSTAALAVDVDLGTFPGTSDGVADGTVLADQWRSIGILFDASPSNVNPIKEDFGGSTANLFFSPDTAGVDAIFEFVVPGTSTPSSATAFSLRPFFNPGESAELVGLDGSSNEVAVDTVTPGDIGNSSQSITMSISGTFERVEWRTQGNPGIAAGQLSFELGDAIVVAEPPPESAAPISVPLLPVGGLFALAAGLLIAGLACSRGR